MSDFLQPHGLQSARFLCPWDLPGKNTGVGSHFLLQGIFPTQGLNPDLLHLLQSRRFWVQLQSQEDPLEKEMANHLSILVWKIPWTEETGRL